MNPPTDERRCVATSKHTGERCEHWAMKGTTVCHIHGGRAPQVKAAAARRMAEAAARVEAIKLGVPADVSPGPALLAMVCEAMGNVEFYRQRIEGLGAEVTDVDGAGAASREVPHVLVRMYDGERERVAQFSALAIKAGIEARHLELAQVEMRFLFGAITAAMTDAGMLPAQQEAFRAALAERIKRRPLGLAG